MHSAFRAQRVWRQNVLSANTTAKLLELLQPVYVFTGHDHEGCRYSHPLPSAAIGSEPTVEPSSGPATPPRAREVTVRSVMAEFSGNAELFELGEGDGAVKYASGPCPFFTHVEIKVLLAVLLASGVGTLAWLGWGLRRVVLHRQRMQRKRKLY